MFVPEPRVKKSLRAEKKERNKKWGLQDGGEQGESLVSNLQNYKCTVKK